ncbi:MAG: Shedu anti-phage system protein SduA domain-containing protein [Thermoguttaceae bacterium]
MAVVLIASDLEDDYVKTTLPDLLKQAGHVSEVVHPLEQMAKVIRETCLACGGIDLGILVHSTNSSSGQDSPYRIAKHIREIPDSFSFRNAVKGKSLPLLVIGKDLMTSLSAIEYDALSQLDWVSTYSLEPSKGSPLGSLAAIDLLGQLNGGSAYRLEPSDEVPRPSLPSAVNDLIYNWRTALLHELECVGYAVILAADGSLTVNPTFKKMEVEGEILAPNTSLACLRDSGYLIVSSDVCRASHSYDELANLIKNFRVIAKARKTKPEEVFQTFFSENPRLLFQQPFSQIWTKPRLPRPEDLSKWLEPDFVVKPSVMPQIGSKWRVLDIKLPDVRLTKSSKFHPTFSAKLFHGLQQVYNYRRYFGREDAARFLLKEFGYQPRNPQLAILIGRRPTSRETQILGETFESTGMYRVEIITYDELLDAQSLWIETQLEWLKRLN